MVLLHGMGSDHTHVEVLASMFGDRYFTVLPDLRGHGASDQESDRHDIATLADDVAWLCAQLGVHDITLVGHSLGGVVSLAVAAAHPGLVSRLVLLDPGIALSDEMSAGLSDFYAGLDDETYAAVLREYLIPLMFVPSDPPQTVQAVMDCLTAMPLRVFRQLGEGIVAFDSMAAVARVSCPTAVVTPQFMIGDIARVEAAAPGWEFGRVLGTGHYMQMVTPEQTEAMITQFLRTHPLGGGHGEHAS